MTVTARRRRAEQNTIRSVWLLFPTPVAKSPTPRSFACCADAPHQKPGEPERGHMYKNILIPTDGSDLAEKAVKSGIAFAKELNAKITVLTVAAPFHIFTFNTHTVEDTPAEYRKRIGEHTAKTLEMVANAAKAAGVACDTVQVEHEHAYQAIIDTARSKGCDLIMMASHGRRGIAAVVLGSETVKVLTHSKIPVLVHR
jgi:nucleotide-binding universal stress UspA family protein